MGYVRNHAIIVTGTFGDFLAQAHAKAIKIFPYVSPISPIEINGSQSFFIPPDGSKEGWPESIAGDRQRAKFLKALRAYCNDDGSSPLDWCEVYYGGDDTTSEVTAHSHENIAKA